MTDTEFQPARGLGNPHVQTIGARATRSSIPARFTRTRIDTPDGDFLDLDAWESDATRGVCLLLHGLEGCAYSGYMTSTCTALARRGIRGVALNFRSCSGEPNRTAQSYHSGRTDDIETALAWVARSFPDLPLGAVGFSLGGNALLNLLGRAGDRPSDAAPPNGPLPDALRCAVAVSVPYDLGACADRLEVGASRIYQRYFMKKLRRKAAEKTLRFPDEVSPLGATAPTIRAFDDAITAPLHGFRDAEDYYTQCSARRFVGSVTLPTLLIQSSDDPLVPGHTLPLDRIRDRPNLALSLTSRGGHVGYLGRGFRSGTEGWMEARIAEYVARGLEAPSGIG